MTVSEMPAKIIEIMAQAAIKELRNVGTSDFGLKGKYKMIAFTVIVMALDNSARVR